MNHLEDDELIEDEVPYDDELDEQLAWEEQLEKEYAKLAEDESEKQNRAMGNGFSKQKKVMEENRYYRGDIKRPVDLKDKTDI